MSDDARIAVIPYTGFVFGVEWSTEECYPYPLHISIRIPFVSFDIGIGHKRLEAQP